MSVTASMEVVPSRAQTLWGHSFVAVIVDTYWMVMEGTAMVGTI